MQINISMVSPDPPMSSQQDLQEAAAGTCCGSSTAHRDGDVLRGERGNLFARCASGQTELERRRCMRTVTPARTTREGRAAG